MSQTTVDFYLYSSHEVAVWEPLWRCLRQRGVEAAFVLEPPGVHRAMGSVPNPDDGWFDDKSGEVVDLVDHATHEHLSQLLEQRQIPWIDRSRPNADAVITTQGIGWLDHYTGLRLKTEYGASAFIDVYGHGPINEGLDAVLAHGPFSARAISAHLPANRIHVVGYPKWAPAQRDGLTREQAREELGLDPDRTLVAWLPTWAHNATIGQYTEALAGLADDYLVVAKPHHNSVRFEADRLNSIDSRIVVRRDLHSLVPLMIAADVVVADSRSGSLAETFLADRPVVGLLPGLTAAANGIIGGLDGAVVWCQHADQLGAAVADALAVDRSAERKRWRGWLFGDSAGDDDQVAANTVVELIEARQRRSTVGLPLAALDKLIDKTPEDDAAAFVATFSHAWPLWSGHPRLLGMLNRATPDLDDRQMLTCARLVRAAGYRESCPLRATLADTTADPVRSLVAAALVALVFEDGEGIAWFCDRVDETPPDRFEDALFALDIVPASLPAFVHCAATTPERCLALAAALDSFGADEQAAIINAYAESLVSQ